MKRNDKLSMDRLAWEGVIQDIIQGMYMLRTGTEDAVVFPITVNGFHEFNLVVMRNKDVHSGIKLQP